MKFPEPQESRMYGNPEDVLAAKQAQRANEQRREEAKPRRTLTVKAGWSEARKRAEELFHPADPCSVD
jgi:hypothetical protein